MPIKKNQTVIFSMSMKKIWKKSHDSLIVNKTVMISSVKKKNIMTLIVIANIVS
jgi:hypothetical protein